jgi:uncharacterized protein (TIGR04255 family)
LLTVQLFERTLPDFEDPPVTEVALGVQVDPPLALTTASFGQIWALYKDRFPKTKDEPPLLPVFEDKDPRARQLIPMRWAAPPLPRWWFLNESETELLQVQNDKFVRNWRKVGTGDKYPRYEQIRDGFDSDLRALLDFARRERLGEPRPTQCEVTYVNHIRAGTVWQRHGAIDPVLKWWHPADRSGILGEPEDIRIAVRYTLSDDTGSFLGRLTVELQPAVLDADQTPILVLTLTARGRPEGAGVEGVLKFLDRGRRMIVNGFAEITTDTMQTRVWKRTR